MKTEYVEKFWRDAVPADATEDPPMTARFTHYPNGFPGNTETVIGLLRGVVQYKSNRNPDWFDAEGNRYVTAQVYDPPLGFAIGEGYRLVDIDRDDHRQPGIEYWSMLNKAWLNRSLVGKAGEPFSTTEIYRIPITPREPAMPNTDPLDTVERAIWNGKECFVLTRFNIVPKAHTDGTVSLERVILQEVHDDNVPLRFAFAKDLLPITPKPKFVK